MPQSNGPIYAVIVAFALLVLSGFFITFDKISSLSAEVKNLELQLKLTGTPSSQQSAIPTPQSPEGQDKNSPEGREPKTEVSAIPTAIIFDTQSSKNLLPQTKVTITVESVSKTLDGTVSVNIKAFTGEANGYSALEPWNLFEIISLDGNNQKAFRTDGSFNSMPAKSAVIGSVLFKISAAQPTIILQVGITESARFYEIDFDKKTYRETTIG